MKWMEIVHLRTINGLNREQIQELCHQPPDAARNEQVIEQRVFFHHKIESDYCIVLVCASDDSAFPPGNLGLQLAFSLKEFGSVHHAVWVEFSNMAKIKHKGDKDVIDKF